MLCQNKLECLYVANIYSLAFYLRVTKGDYPNKVLHMGKLKPYSQVLDKVEKACWSINDEEKKFSTSKAAGLKWWTKKKMKKQGVNVINMFSFVTALK